MMPVDLSKKTAMVFDNGLFVDMAARLGRNPGPDFGEVLFVCPWIDPFPDRRAASIGEGIEGIKVIDSPFGKEFDRTDVFVFLDVYLGKLQDRLEKMGMAVWGAHEGGEAMELDRVGMKEHMKAVGLPVGPYKVVTGMEALRAYLKEHKGVYVKVSKWRGICETFHSPSYQDIEWRLDKMEYKLGCFKRDQEFIIEDELPDTVELAADGYTVDGRFPDQGLCGLEKHGKGWVGKFGPLAKLPPALRLINEKLAPHLKRSRYRGFLSLECLIDKKGKGIMTDACSRCPSPPSGLYQEFFTNFSQIVWGAAHGHVVEPIPAGKFGCEILMNSQWAQEDYQAIKFPEKIRNQVKLHNVCKMDGRYTIIPQATPIASIGSVVGWGDTKTAAMVAAQNIGEQVKGYDIDVQFQSLDEIDEEIEKCEKFGIHLF